jgi:hypothetical protein
MLRERVDREEAKVAKGRGERGDIGYWRFVIGEEREEL